jgi:hypothetical protein
MPASSAVRATASRAAASIAGPPDACTLSIHTPRRVAAAQACATVFGMSWNLRSRNTRNPRRTSSRTSPASADVNSSLPTLSAHCAGSSRAASASAVAVSAKSSATMTRGSATWRVMRILPGVSVRFGE